MLKTKLLWDTELERDSNNQHIKHDLIFVSTDEKTEQDGIKSNENENWKKSKQLWYLNFWFDELSIFYIFGLMSSAWL